MNLDSSSSIKRIAIIGPECTGKSELSKHLADYFHTTWVPEYARAYLDDLGRQYRQSDLVAIAKGQVQLEDEFARHANKILFCDTNLYVVKVWSNFKYGKTDQAILTEIEKRKYDLYLLTFVDLPWQADPLREHPDRRQELYSIYLQEMQNQPTPYVEIKGEGNFRKQTAIDAVEKLLKA
jgi:NadR type nicotinamide-nucleotide adenylyltransferase